MPESSNPRSSLADKANFVETGRMVLVAFAKDDSSATGVRRALLGRGLMRQCDFGDVRRMG